MSLGFLHLGVKASSSSPHNSLIVLLRASISSLFWVSINSRPFLRPLNVVIPIFMSTGFTFVLTKVFIFWMLWPLLLLTVSLKVFCSDLFGRFCVCVCVCVCVFLFGLLSLLHYKLVILHASILVCVCVCVYVCVCVCVSVRAGVYVCVCFFFFLFEVTWIWPPRTYQVMA